MFINRYLIQFAKGSGRLVAVACLYELVLTALGTGISLCCAFASRMILGDEGVPLFTNVVQIFCCIAVGLIIRFILSKQKVINWVNRSTRPAEKSSTAGVTPASHQTGSGKGLRSLSY